MISFIHLAGEIPAKIWGVVERLQTEDSKQK